MNQQRLQSYINLIQNLLDCPSGEEWILLRQNETLVNPELVQVMEQAATQLANQGNLQEAKFLHNLAGQIHHLFVAQTIHPPDTEDHSVAYLDLIKALLACPPGSEDELLAAHQELIGPGLVQMMQQVSAQLAASGDQQAANHLHHWAMELNRLWLQQHSFQPVLKPDLQPKHPDSPGTPPFMPPQNKFSPPIPVSPLKPSAPTEATEDLWAELSGEPVQTQSQPLSNLETPPAESAKPTAVEDLAPAPPRPDLSPYEQISRHLETMAGALTRLSEALMHSAPPPPDPLWYMEVLERAYAENWVLTSAEIHKLIGVQPTCPKGSQMFQRGCWVFAKAGKVGTQTGWRVKKEMNPPV